MSYQTKDRKNSDSLIEYPDVKVILVMDNASYHRSSERLRRSVRWWL